jgi:hypothetical protein
MKIFGKPLSEYFAFQSWFIVLIVVVGVARLALSLAGVPASSVKWVSMSALALAGVVYCAVQVPRTGFGGYRHLLPLYAMQAGVANLISAAAIVLAIFTGTDNIYTAPEYSGGGDGKTWLHAGAHLVFGVIVGSLIAWLLGSGIMWITKKVSPGRTTPAAA